MWIIPAEAYAPVPDDAELLPNFQRYLRQMMDRLWLEVRDCPDMYAVHRVHPSHLDAGGWYFLYVIVGRMLQQHCHTRRPSFVTLTADDDENGFVLVTATWHSADPGLYSDAVALSAPTYPYVPDPVFVI